jgi:hypothetical protein
MVIDIVANRPFEFAGTTEGATPQAFFSQHGKPAFDLIDPRGSSGRKVQMEARPLYQPTMNQRCLVGALVVQNQVHVEALRHRGVNGVEKLAELDGTMTAVALANQMARFDIQRRK